MIPFTLSYPYEKTPEVMRLVKEYGLTINNQSYGDRCLLSARVALRNREALHAKIRLLNILLVTIEIIE